MSAFDTELRALLATPTRAQQILTDGLPTVIADDIIRRTARALPTIHPDETPDAYALRLLHIAKGI